MTTLTSSQQALKEFLIQENEAFWANSKEGKPEDYVFNIDDAIAHEINSGINSIEEYKHSQAATDHFYAHAEVYGWKPRGKDYKQMSTEAILAEIDAMYQEREENDAFKAMTNSEKIAMVNDKHTISNTPFSGLKDLMNKA